MQYSVLIVDDDDDDRQLLSYSFKENNVLDVGLFKDANSVLHYLSTEETSLPSLIISDFNMPRLSGLDLLEKVKDSDKLKDINFVIFSTYTPVAQVESCMKLGASGYYSKPSSFTEMTKLVKEVFIPIVIANEGTGKSIA